jgi:hypothetical protein
MYLRTVITIFDASRLINVNENVRLCLNCNSIDHDHRISALRLVSAWGPVLLPVGNCLGSQINARAVVWKSVALGAVGGGGDLVSRDVEPVQVSTGTRERPLRSR